MSESDFRRLRPVGSLFGDTHNGTVRPDLAPGELFRTGFRRVWPRLRTMLRDDSAQFVMAAVLSDSDEVVYHSLGLGEDPFIKDGSVSDTIIGRHPQCDVHLNDDESLSLRHILLRVQRDKFRGVSLRCMDLFTDSGLFDDAGRPFRSLRADGHLFFRAADYMMYVVGKKAEMLPELADDAWTTLQKHSGRESFPPALKSVGALTPRPRLQLVCDSEDVPQFTKIDGALNLGTVDLDSNKAIGVISLRGWDVDVSVPVPGNTLARGLLIGRYARCQLRTEIHGDFSELSRVHLLILLDETGLWAIDTASSNGTAMNGRYFRTARLDTEAIIELPGEITLRWQPI